MSLRKGLLAMLVITAMAGAYLGAQESAGTNVLPGKLDFGASTFGLVPMQYDFDFDAHRAQALNTPMMAGLRNMIFGLWSWTNGDIFGGALTAGLEVVGIATVIAGFGIPVSEETQYVPLAVAGAGMGVFFGGAIYGYLRGASQHKKQNAETTAETPTAWTGNPMDHVSFDIVPNGGMLTFKMGF